MFRPCWPRGTPPQLEMSLPAPPAGKAAVVSPPRPVGLRRAVSVGRWLVRLRWCGWTHHHHKRGRPHVSANRYSAHIAGKQLFQAVSIQSNRCPSILFWLCDFQKSFLNLNLHHLSWPATKRSYCFVTRLNITYISDTNI